MCDHLNSSFYTLPVKIPAFLLESPLSLDQKIGLSKTMSQNDLVYSTDMGRITAKKAQQVSPQTDGIIRIRRETKGRKGKGITSLSGMAMNETEIKQLCSELKKMCGTGGAVKNGIIEIQGDNREKIKLTLEKRGLKVKLAGG
ncbi:MAG: translation initiation factor 1 [Paraglaciecola sp.]